MTLNYSVIPPVSKNLQQYCRETKGFLDQFDTSLWLKFTQCNPYRQTTQETLPQRHRKDLQDNQIHSRPEYR